MTAIVLLVLRFEMSRDDADGVVGDDVDDAGGDDSDGKPPKRKKRDSENSDSSKQNASLGTDRYRFATAEREFKG